MEKLGKKIRASLRTTFDKQDDTGVTARRTSVTIPHDLTTEILTRLPVKSLVRFLCVSKLWASTIRRPDFNKSFITRSSTQPHLLFIASMKTYLGHSRLVFFSSPQDVERGSSFVANHVVTFPGDGRNVRYQSLCGLILLQHWNRFSICNPSTRQFKILPKIETHEKGQRAGGYLGYDPIEGRYKVLCVTCPDNGESNSDQEIWVFTLGDEEWRKIECPVHVPWTTGACIDGVLYYGSSSNGTIEDTIVCFNVRSEKFNLIKLPKRMSTQTLMNHKGKLAAIRHVFSGTRTLIELWVLEDAERQEWSMKSSDIPHTWIGFSAEWPIQVSTIDAGELVLAPTMLCDPFHVLYYNPERRRLRRIKIEGITDHRFRLDHEEQFPKDYIQISRDHVESIMLL